MPINLTNILEGTTMLPACAAGTLAMLLFVVVSRALALLPQDSAWILLVEINR